MHEQRAGELFPLGGIRAGSAFDDHDASRASGCWKVATPRVKLAEKFKWAATWSDANATLLGLAEVQKDAPTDGNVT